MDEKQFYTKKEVDQKISTLRIAILGICLVLIMVIAASFAIVMLVHIGK